MVTSVTSCFLIQFRTTPEVCTKLYFVEISLVTEKSWLFNHKKADFFAFQLLDCFSLCSLLKIETFLGVNRLIGSTYGLDYGM